MAHKALERRRVNLEVIDVCYGDSHAIDNFIAGINDERSAYQIFELTQSQDVSKWIEDPSKIETIQENLKDFSDIIANMDKPVYILDAGCYGGYLYDYIRYYVLRVEEFNYTGIDVQAEAVEAAAEAHSGFKNACFRWGDIYEIDNDFKENTFDIVFCSRVLIHLPYFEKALKKLLKVCNTAVFLVLRLEDKEYCKKLKESDLDTGIEATYYYRIFTSDYLLKVASKFGISCEIVEHENSHYSSVIFYKGKRFPDGAKG